jgi:hypothetical protein
VLTRGSGGREISKEEERVNFLAPSSTNVAGKLKQLNLNTQAQSVCVCVSAQLLLVVINKCVVQFLFHESLTFA